MVKLAKRGIADIVYTTMGLAGFWLSSLLVTLIAAPFLGQLAGGGLGTVEFRRAHPSSRKSAKEHRYRIARELHKLRYPHLACLHWCCWFCPWPEFDHASAVVCIQCLVDGGAIRRLRQRKPCPTIRLYVATTRPSPSAVIGIRRLRQLYSGDTVFKLFVIPAAVVGGTLLWQSISEDTPS